MKKKVVEEWVKIYFDNKFMKLLKNVTRYWSENWDHFDLADGTEAVVNTDKVMLYITKGRKHVH